MHTLGIYGTANAIKHAWHTHTHTNRRMGTSFVGTQNVQFRSLFKTTAPLRNPFQLFNSEFGFFSFVRR